MIELEKIYDCAERHLSNNNTDWEGFASGFKAVFGSGMALYQPATPAESGLDIVSSSEIIATTDPEFVSQYFEEKIYEMEEETIEEPENPFEPVRRTDSMGDEAFRELEIAKEYMIPNGIFYKMVIFSIFPNGSPLVLFVWRDEEGGDFSDIEKQRLTLFMRYLASLVSSSNPALVSMPEPPVDSRVHEFGEKYGLTRSEMSILSAMLIGQSLKFIAQSSDRTYGTVRWHVQNILTKCQVKSQKNLLSEFYRLIEM